MKHFRCLLLILVALTAGASARADEPDGFAGIKWNTAEKEVMTAMASRPGVKFDNKQNDVESTVLEFSGGKFDGQPVSTWYLRFRGGRFVSSFVRMHTGSYEEAEAICGQFVRKLKDKYGDGVPLDNGTRWSGENSEINCRHTGICVEIRYGLREKPPKSDL